MNFLELKKNFKKDFTKFKIVRIALLGDSATQMFSQALKAYGYELSINFEIFEAGYDQLESEVYDASSEFYQFQPEFVILFHSSQKLQRSFYQLTNSEKSSFAENHLQKIDSLYQAILKNISARIIYFNLTELNDSVYGNYSNKTEISFLYQLRKINFELMNKCRELKNLFVNDLHALQSQYDQDFIFDPKLYVNADMVFSIDFLPIVAKQTADIIVAGLGKEIKCVILDLDNVLWGGVIGDDGIEKIQIGNLGIGKAFTDFQLWIKQLKERGIVLAVCSKNTEDIAKEPFEKHPEMILKLEDIAVFVANWKNKIDNIKHIQSVLNIGYDTMVFLDDSPFERNFVRSHFPEINVPELPEDPAEYLSFLQKLNLFETTSFTEEDTQRTKQYQEEASRKATQNKFSSETDFLKSIEMIAEVKAFDSFNVPRIAQLIQRSNQFNLRTIRYSENEISNISSSNDYFTLSFSLKDKFGDYGLISIVILKKETKFLFIDTWIMSCRILKRGMEDLILSEIIAIARREGYDQIVGEYISTEKNGIVKDMYSNFGFNIKDNFWVMNVNEFKAKPHFINLKN